MPLAAAGLVAVLGGLVLFAPGWLVGRDTTVSTLTAEQRAKATSDARTALLQAVGGLLLAAGALATWRQVRISREGQVTERFTRAVDQLGSEHLDVRLGALYALERIARDSVADRRTIAEILTAYVRQHSPWPPTQPRQYRDDWPLKQQPDLRTRAPDVQAVLTVLGRGPFPKPTDRSKAEADRLDLRAVDLRRADLAGAHLEGAVLHRAHLEGAVLSDAHLEGAWLSNAHLKSAWLFRAHLKGAVLSDAHLEGAGFHDAHLEGAWLLGAQLKDALLEQAHMAGAWANANTLWPDGFPWRAAGVTPVDDPRAEPAEVDEATASPAVVEARGLATAEPSGRAEGPVDRARTGLDRENESGTPPHHG